eukprot:10774257-Heterocapsa_arctica.AAC.1
MQRRTRLSASTRTARCSRAQLRLSSEPSAPRAGQARVVPDSSGQPRTSPRLKCACRALLRCLALAASACLPCPLRCLRPLLLSRLLFSWRPLS